MNGMKLRKQKFPVWLVCSALLWSVSTVNPLAMAAVPLQAQATGTVTGTATDCAKKALTGTTVRVRLLRDNRQIQEVTPNAQGLFTFANVAFGDYTVQLLLSGNLTRTARAHVAAATPRVTVPMSSSCGSGDTIATATILVLSGLAAGAAIVAIHATGKDASPSK